MFYRSRLAIFNSKFQFSVFYPCQLTSIVPIKIKNIKIIQILNWLLSEKGGFIWLLLHFTKFDFLFIIYILFSIQLAIYSSKLCNYGPTRAALEVHSKILHKLINNPVQQLNCSKAVALFARKLMARSCIKFQHFQFCGEWVA